MKRFFRFQEILFEWSSEKAALNRRKHGIDFETACQAFLDPFVRIEESPWRGAEPRFIAIGMTTSWCLLYVVFAEKVESLRLISARETTPTERRRYENG